MLRKPCAFAKRFRDILCFFFCFFIAIIRLCPHLRLQRVDDIPAAEKVKVGAAKVFAGETDGFAPCTPTAVMEILHHNNIPLKGKKVTVIGSSMVVGKPLAMLLLNDHATVTICHSRTVDLPKVAQEAEILIAAVGRPKMVNADYVRAGQVVIDVGINSDPDNEGKMCGDVDFDSVEPIVDMITPVPGGVGSVTTAVLMKHTLQAAVKNSGIKL